MLITSQDPTLNTINMCLKIKFHHVIVEEIQPNDKQALSELDLLFVCFSFFLNLIVSKNVFALCC